MSLDEAKAQRQKGNQFCKEQRWTEAFFAFSSAVSMLRTISAEFVSAFLSRASFQHFFLALRFSFSFSHFVSASCFFLFCSPTCSSSAINELLVPVLSNRALASIHVCNFEQAIDDCSEVLAHDSRNLKALFRRGMLPILSIFIIQRCFFFSGYLFRSPACPAFLFFSYSCQSAATALFSMLRYSAALLDFEQAAELAKEKGDSATERGTRAKALECERLLEKQKVQSVSKEIVQVRTYLLTVCLSLCCIG